MVLQFPGLLFAIYSKHFGERWRPWVFCSGGKKTPYLSKVGMEDKKKEEMALISEVEAELC